jgi:hypothetical protein
MSENMTEQEFYEQAKQTLRELGVRDVKVGESGTIPVRSQGERVIEELEIYETTGTGQRILNQFPRRGNDRILNQGYDRPVCRLLSCNILDLVGIECTKTNERYIDPTIDFDSLPSVIPNATAYLNPFNARIEGDVEILTENRTEPGKKVKETEYKCSQRTDKESDLIPESGILDFGASHDITIDDTIDGERVTESLGTFSTNMPDVQPDTEVTRDASFRKEGVLSVLRSIIDIWTTGTTRVNVRGEVNIQYEWRGSAKNRTFDIESTMRLPVQNINYGW